MPQTFLTKLLTEIMKISEVMMTTTMNQSACLYNFLYDSLQKIIYKNTYRYFMTYYQFFNKFMLKVYIRILLHNLFVLIEGILSYPHLHIHPKNLQLLN